MHWRRKTAKTKGKTKCELERIHTLLHIHLKALREIIFCYSEDNIGIINIHLSTSFTFPIHPALSCGLIKGNIGARTDSEDTIYVSLVKPTSGSGYIFSLSGRKMESYVAEKLNLKSGSCEARWITNILNGLIEIKQNQEKNEKKK